MFNGSSLSIKNNTNEAYCCTLDDLSKVREGSYLRVNKENAFYVINFASKEELAWDFKVVDSKCISIAEDVIPKLQYGDSIFLSFPQYEMDIVTAILNNGSGYKVGDILSVDAGIPSLDVKEGEYLSTKIIVTNIKEGGVISRIGVKNRGLYIKAPEGECKMKGGSGEGAVFDISFSVLDEALVLEREVSSLSSQDNTSTIIVSNPIQEGLSSGKLSVKKWKLVLNTLYPNLVNRAPYSISRDFTPVLELPMMMQNSLTIDVVYNQAINMLEREIISLREQINEIRNHKADPPVSAPEQ